jgi:DNA gyrase inhibitor GyrI
MLINRFRKENSMRFEQQAIVAGAVFLCLCSGPLRAQEAPAPKPVIVRTLPSQTVLYTVVRGSYDKLGGAFGRLYGLIGSTGIKPVDAAMSVHLNNPKTTASEHLLTEIRIPVDDTAMKLAGTLGAMTDVKTVPQMTVAVGLKPKGSADPSDEIQRVYRWVLQNGYCPVEGPMQKVISDSQTHDYSQMEVEILVPIIKVPAAEK